MAQIKSATVCGITAKGRTVTEARSKAESQATAIVDWASSTPHTEIRTATDRSGRVWVCVAEPMFADGPCSRTYIIDPVRGMRAYSHCSRHPQAEIGNVLAHCLAIIADEQVAA